MVSRNDTWCVTVAIEDGGEKMIGWESSCMLHDDTTWWTCCYELYDERWRLVAFRDPRPARGNK